MTANDKQDMSERMLRVLLVEDDPLAEKVVLRALRNSGYNPEHLRVHNEPELVEALAGNEWDIALCDYCLPGYSGIEALACMKKADPDLPVIVLSGTVGEEVAVQVMKAGAADFITKPLLSRLGPAIERELTEARTRSQTRVLEELHRAVLDNIGIGVALIGPRMEVLSLNRQMSAWFPHVHARDKPLCYRAYSDPPRDEPCPCCPVLQTLMDSLRHESVIEMPSRDCVMNYRIVSSPIKDDTGKVIAAVEVIEDVTESQRAQTQSLHDQKMESIGQLAAGIAHEINTPTQFIGDHLHFLKEGIADIEPLFGTLDALIASPQSEAMPPNLVEQARTAREEADLAYFREHAPKAIEQALDGVNRVATIVRAMRDFAHPGPAEMTPTNLNETIQSTVTVCRNEWKYAAEMETDFDTSLPPVSCVAGEINQVVLNMVVNAAHAIEDVLGRDSEAKGRITVTTRREDDQALISIADTGSGISEKDRAQIFNPFFTTKEVGKGTGQGLAIAHNIVVKKHSGSIAVESKVGKGTTFHIRLPLNQPGKSVEQCETNEQPL